MLALVLAQARRTRGGDQLQEQVIKRHRALSAWWWSSTLIRQRFRTNDEVEKKVDGLVEWLRTGIPERRDPVEIGQGRNILEGETRGFCTARYGSRNAISRLILSLLLRTDPVDLITGERIDGLMLAEPARKSHRRADPEQIELHHIFPRAHLRQHGVPEDQQDLIANIAPLSGATNGWINDRPPSEYVQELIDKLGRDRVDDVLRTHMLRTELLLEPDAFARLIDERTRVLRAALQRLFDPRQLEVLDPHELKAVTP